MGLDDFKTMVDIYGIKGAVFLLILFIIVSFLKSKVMSSIFTKISEKFVEKFMKAKTQEVNSQVKMISESDIVNHDIFNYIDFWMYSKIPTFQFSTDFRTVVFRRYLTIYLKSYKKNIADFVNSKDYQTMDSAKIWKALLELINRIIYDYEREMVDSGISKIVIEKMKSKNNDNITLTIDLIEGICNSQFYDSDKNMLKVYSILNILLSVLENTISNSEAICNSINGQLRGMTFTDNGTTYTEP